jgi:protein-tyrosine phosphatase
VLVAQIRICFVCLGNICRSPTAEGVFKHLVARAKLTHHFEVRSAGTGSWHVGELPDPRTRAAAERRGIVLESRGRHFTAPDFDAYDYVVAMDRNNLTTLHGLTSRPADRQKIHLLRDFDPLSPKGAEVPDPYYGGPAGFDAVLDHVEAAAAGLLAHLVERHKLG